MVTILFRLSFVSLISPSTTVENVCKSVCPSQQLPPKLTNIMYVFGYMNFLSFNFQLGKTVSNIYRCYDFSLGKVHFRKTVFYMQISHLSPLLLHWQRSIIYPGYLMRSSCIESAIVLEVFHLLIIHHSLASALRSHFLYF